MKLVARLNYLRLVIAAAYIGGILITPRLWFGFGRTFPRAPLVDLPDFLLSIDYVVSILLLAALALSLVSDRSRYLIAVVILTVLLVLFDQTRLQPWVYQYAIMLVVLACHPTRRDDKIAEPVLLALQLVTILLYVWSGIQKLNWSFGHEVLPGLFEGAGVQLPAIFSSHLSAFGIAVALFEVLIGVGLVIRQTRRTAVVLALGMHLILLLLLIAAGQNSAVWVWNIGMMAMVITLFWRFDNSFSRSEPWRGRGGTLVNHLPKAVIVVCGLAPALSFLGGWDLYLSAALYSGNVPVAVIRIDDQMRGRLPPSVQQQMFRSGQGELMLPLYEWSMTELNVPAYPELRVFRQVARQVCALSDNPQAIELIVKGRPALIDGNYAVTRTPCAELFVR